MALKMRLSRGGSKKRPHYRIVIADARAPRDGRFIERIGIYNPLLPKDSENRVSLDEERAKYWVSKGVEPTDRVRKFLALRNLIEDIERNNPQKAILDINDELNTFFKELLISNQGSETREYLSNRGISEDSISRFELGYSPKDGTSGLKYLTDKGIDLATLAEAGVVRKTDHGEYRDWFRGRLIIPIRNFVATVCCAVTFIRSV